MKNFILSLLMLWNTFIIYGQGESNIWSFGRYYSLDFNSNPPILNDHSFLNGQPYPAIGVPSPYSFVSPYKQSIVVSNPAGQMQFMVNLFSYINPSFANEPQIYDRNENPIPGTHLMNMMEATGAPVVIPHPGNSTQYYIFYVRNGGLLYTLFDMGLNNGLGNMVPGQHNVVISGFNTVVGQRMTAVKGCTGVWLVVRNKIGNYYQSFLVDQVGLHEQSVVSEIGLLPPENYGGTYAMLKSSPDGRLLATGAWRIPGSTVGYLPGGLELYDFEPCSGKLKNARLLDTNHSFYGVCFSPDNTKLYATQNIPKIDYVYFTGEVYQFDLTLPTLVDIINSKTLILTNLITIQHFVTVGCNVPRFFGLGDMKLGPDGKIYMLNQSEGTCRNTVNPLINNPGMAFHIIHQPNNIGMTCQPEINGIFNSINSMSTTDHGSPNEDLPRDIVLASAKPPDTLSGQNLSLTVCFRDSATIAANENGACHYWDDGSREIHRIVTQSGTYWVRYFRDCTVYTDTFRVNFVPLPNVNQLQYGCPGELMAKATNKLGDATLFNYKLFDGLGNEIAVGVGNAGFKADGLTEGSYRLHISTTSGCDTTLDIVLAAYPKPELVTQPADTLIRYGDSITLQVSGASLYVWSPVAPLDTATKSNPVARPVQPTLFTVVGINAYGCRDTGFVNVNIDYRMPDMVPNAFSPNGDGINDVFRVEGTTYQRVRVFEVFNRFGQRVFSTLDAAKGWDGTQNGRPSDAGTYYYLIQLDYPDGTSKTYKGDVVLVR